MLKLIIKSPAGRASELGKSIQRVRDHCNRICGKKQSECYVNKREQINCMADIIINKTSSIIMTLGASLEMDDGEFLRETATESLSHACELSNWIRYLQIVPDLRTLSTLVLDADSIKKRKEIRYPVPEEFEGRIKVVIDDIEESILINFSQTGMQIRSPHSLKSGTVIDCHLVSDLKGGPRKHFRAESMYCAPDEDSFMCGARISEMHGSDVFNFFSFVYQFILEMKS